MEQLQTYLWVIVGVEASVIAAMAAYIVRLHKSQLEQAQKRADKAEMLLQILAGRQSTTTGGE